MHNIEYLLAVLIFVNIDEYLKIVTLVLCAYSSYGYT